MHDNTPETGIQGQLTKLTPEQVVFEIGHGSAAVESEFYRRYYQTTLKYLIGCTEDTARAEDLTQEVLLVVLLKLRSASLDHPAFLTRYVYQTAKYLSVDWYRRRGNQVELRENLDLESSDIVSHEITMTRARTRARLLDVLRSQLIPRDRELMLRFYIYEESKQNICESLDLTSEHFDRVISRARKRFRKVVSLDEQLEEELRAAA